jgi:cholesterol transport system auxiliary component
MKTRMIDLFPLGLLIFALCSCSLLIKPSAVHDFGYPYTNAPSEATVLSPHSPVTLEAPKWLADNHIHYRLLYATPTQVRFYSLDRWIAPPSELFEQLLNNNGKQWPSPVAIHLQIFEQQFDSPDKAKVVMRFTATTMPDDNQHKSSIQEFNLKLPCTTPDAKGAVTGFNLLTRQAADKVQAWVMETN